MPRKATKARPKSRQGSSGGRWPAQPPGKVPDDDFTHLRNVRETLGDIPPDMRDRGVPPNGAGYPYRPLPSSPPDDDAQEEENVMTPDVEKQTIRRRLAAGHPVTARQHGDAAQGRVTILDGQTRAPSPLAGLVTAHGDPACQPLASSIQMHQGHATVQVMDQAEAASATLGPQLGNREPSGHPSLAGGPFHPAPSGHGETFGTTPHREGTGLAATPLPDGPMGLSRSGDWAQPYRSPLAPRDFARRAPGE